jgi:translation initiation factor 2 beta subunit (eIF-2beta)/eIF-5
VKKAAAKKVVVANDDDDEPVTVKKPVAKKAVAAANDDDDEAGPVTKKASKKAAKPAADESSDDELVTKKPKEAGGAAAAAGGKKHADPNALDSDSDSDDGSPQPTSSAQLVDLIDYDAMTEEAFLAHLKAQTKAERLEEKRLVEEHKVAAKVDVSEDDRHFDGSLAFSYKFMLDRVLAICKKNNPELAQVERIQLPMPKLEKHSSKKTALTNFKELCQALHRSQDEVKDFIEKSLTTQGSVDGNNCLVLKYQNAKVSQFEKLFGQYVEEYVKCRACGRINTDLAKEASSRLLLMNCRDCKASRYIQVAGAATFTAQTTKRSKQRNSMV